MTTILYDVKDPGAVLDYEIDWTPSLVNGETITASTFTPTLAGGGPDTGITVQSSSFAATNTTVWLSGGHVGDVMHMIVNHIITNQGREDDQTLYIDICQK